MHRDHSEERIVNSANSSPRHNSRISNAAAGSGTTLMGLLTKRSTKIQPHSANCNNDAIHDNPKDDGAFAKTHLTNDSTITLPQNGINQLMSQIVSIDARPDDILDADETEALAKSYSSGFISNFQRKSKTIKLKHNAYHHDTTDGSQSDGGGTSDVVLRKSHNKVKSPSHNRFSHQFSLCCKADKRSATPVTVHYSHNHCGVQGSSRKDHMTLSWSSADNPSLPLNSAIINPNYDCLQAPSRKYLECASAPQSPVSRKCPLFSNSESIATSPSSNSLKNITDIELSPTDMTGTLGEGASGGPAIRPLAVSESRSRLRLKLFPPGKEIPASMIDPNMKLVSTPQQHMSSPNIVGQAEATNVQKGEALDQVKHAKFHFFSNENVQRQGSSSGLARQALMAAQVLSLIPTDKARESLLDGCLGPSSLLGPSELSKVLPNKEVFVFIGTWNMNGQYPPKQMNDFVLPVNVEHVPDIVAIGTQESTPDRFDWEVTIQETLGPSHVLFHSTTLGTLHLAIYLRRDLIWYCSAPEEASFSVRTGSAFRTKGAVAISFCLFGTSMLFVTSHLTAHQQKVKERVSDVKRIIHALDLPRNLNLRHKNKDVTQNFDNVFWCGDLNFRLGEPREKLLEWIQNTKFPLPSHLPNGYMHTDQLSSVLADGAAFRGFMEANITFPPTYKYDPGTQHFDTSSKQRAPAYTDRILYKFRQNQGLTIRRQSILPGISPDEVNHPNVECLLYDSVPSITTSDHKPVWALFKTSIRAGTDSIPLAAGLFCRDIYLEGMKRRLHNEYSDSSAVCAIQ